MLFHIKRTINSLEYLKILKLYNCFIFFQTIDTLGKMGLCVSASAGSKKKRHLLERHNEKVSLLMLKEKESLEKGTVESNSSSDIIGDNIDLTRSPSQMSVDRRRKSWHWFLLIGLKKRVLNPDLDDTTPICDINTLDNCTFIPNLSDCSKLDDNFRFHIMNVLVKYIDCLKKYKKCLPKGIPHPHLDELSGKSEFAILDMLDKSENKAEDMIAILEHIHEHYIARTDDENPLVIKRKVFGGDVLTNERAYSAQLAMLNGNSDYERLAGVIHRPEGLHRMMNLLLVFTGVQVQIYCCCSSSPQCMLVVTFYRFCIGYSKFILCLSDFLSRTVQIYIKRFDFKIIGTSIFSCGR